MITSRLEEVKKEDVSTVEKTDICQEIALNPKKKEKDQEDVSTVEKMVICPEIVPNLKKKDLSVMEEVIGQKGVLIAEIVDTCPEIVLNLRKKDLLEMVEVIDQRAALIAVKADICQENVLNLRKKDLLEMVEVIDQRAALIAVKADICQEIVRIYFYLIGTKPRKPRESGGFGRSSFNNSKVNEDNWGVPITVTNSSNQIENDGGWGSLTVSKHNQVEEGEINNEKTNENSTNSEDIWIASGLTGSQQKNKDFVLKDNQNSSTWD
jgi:hypothetical protein